jgi:hypothetical protein
MLQLLYEDRFLFNSRPSIVSLSLVQFKETLMQNPSQTQLLSELSLEATATINGGLWAHYPVSAARPCRWSSRPSYGYGFGQPSTPTVTQETNVNVYYED